MGGVKEWAVMTTMVMMRFYKITLDGERGWEYAHP